MYGSGSNWSLHIPVTPTPVRTDMYEGEKFAVINHPALPEATPSAGKSYLVRPVQSHSSSEAENVKFLMGTICLVCFVLSCPAPETALALPRCCSGYFESYLGKTAPCRDTAQSRN